MDHAPARVSFFWQAFLAAQDPQQALVAWQLGEWLGVACSKQTRADLLTACERRGLEASFHTAASKGGQDLSYL